jgi:hypothetical protein
MINGDAKGVFMKDRFRLFKIMALALLLAFSFVACEEWFNFSEEEGGSSGNDDEYCRLGIGDFWIIKDESKPLSDYVSSYLKNPLNWYSNRPSIATVSDTGVVQGHAEGKAVISILTSDGKSTDSCNVTVLDPKANYVIENESSYQGSEFTQMTNFFWYTLAEREYGEVNSERRKWAANYIKTNKIKIILSDNDSGYAWIRPDLLDRIYINAPTLNYYLGFHNEGYDNLGNMRPGSGFRGRYYSWITHETMHLDQYSGDSFSLMAGMRPDICAAAEMLTEYLAHFYTEGRFEDENGQSTWIYLDTPNAIERQSRLMILSTDPWSNFDWNNDNPSLPHTFQSTNWFNNELSGYAQHAFISGMPERYAFTSPLRNASREDILRLTRSLLNCRDPQMADVTDDAIMYVFNALRKAAIGDSKYMFITDYFHPWTVYQPDFDRFQNLIAQWDANYAAQQ